MLSDVNNNNILITNSGTKNMKITKTTRAANSPSCTMWVEILAFCKDKKISTKERRKLYPIRIPSHQFSLEPVIVTK